jgi:hypothetical protein
MLLEALGGTAISFFDLLTDCYMIYFYYTNQQASFATATIVMIAMSMLMQLYSVVVMYHNDTKALKRELFYTLTLVKTGRVQLNVLMGQNTQGCSMSSTREMIFFEMQELVRARKQARVAASLLQLFF